MSTLATEALRDFFAPAECHAPARPIRVGLAGLGRHGLAHAAVLSTIPNVELVGVADVSRIARREARGLGFRATGFAHVEKLATKLTPEALIVSASYPDAAAAARVALDAGADVLVERPLELTREQAHDLISLAAEYERKLVFAVPMVHQPVFGQLSRLLAAGVLGRVFRASGSVLASRRPDGLRSTDGDGGLPGGVLTALAADVLFLLVSLLGTPTSVTATWTRRRHQPEDEISGTLRLRDGTRLGFDASWQASGYPRPAHVIEIDGENGKLLASDDGLELELSQERGVFDSGNTHLGPERLPQRARFDTGGDALYVQDAGFLAWATGGEAPGDAAEQVMPVFDVRDALYASAAVEGIEKEVAR